MKKAIARLTLIIAILVIVISIFNTQSIQADDEAGNLATGARTILRERCYGCHGANGAAQKNVFVLNYARLITTKVVIPNDENSLLLKVVERGAMPPTGDGLSSEQKAVLRNWILAGAPNWDKEKSPETARGFIPETEILSLIREDLAKSRERNRPFLRYFSITHLFNAGTQEKEMEIYRVALAKLLNSLSWHKELAVPMPVNPLKTVFRVDLRDYQWTAATWNLLLQVYPYGIHTQDSEVIKLLSGAELPYLRADWFIARASVPPLYHQILGLPQTLGELERMLGIDVARNLEEEKNVIRAGLRASGVSQNNRVVERHVSPYGAYWKSFDFRNNLGAQNIFRDPIRLNPAGGEVIFNLPNGLQAYFLANGAGQRLDVAPIEIVADRNNPDEPVIQNGRSCMSCHFDGIKSFRDDVRAAVKGMPLSFADQEHALALYLQPEATDRLIEKDRRTFQDAIVQLNQLAASNPKTEPINFAARRFQAELSLVEAAAESGLEQAEFEQRLQSSARLTNLGFRQVLGAEGGIKRDLWERSFGEVVREFELGSQLLRRRSLQQLSGLRQNGFENTTIVAQSAARTNPFDNSPETIMKTARSVFIKSRTIFLKNHLMEVELRKVREFQALGLQITRDEKQADLCIELDRPPFTFIYQYTVINPATRVLLLKGKITAFNGEVAAPKIAKEIISQIQGSRSTVAR
jgi:mono/diheme cytochrome c family protein